MRAISAYFVGACAVLVLLASVLFIVGIAYEPDWLLSPRQRALVRDALTQLGGVGLVLALLSSPLLLLSPSRRTALLRGASVYLTIAAVTVLVPLSAGELFLRAAHWDGLSFSSHGGPLVRRFERGFSFNHFDGPSRGPEVVGPKQLDDFRILVQGDSITWGQGVKEEAALYTNRLLKMLNADDPHIQLAVLARGGREIDGHLAQLRRWGQEIVPDIIIYQWYINDLEIDKSHRPHTDRVWQRFFLHRYLMRASYLWFFLDYRLNLLLPSDALSYEDYIEAEFAPGTPGWQRFTEEFHAWATEAKKLTPLVLMALYPHVESSYVHFLDVHSRMRTLGEQEGVRVIDLTSSLDSFKDNYARTYASPFDGHPNAAVHERIAGTLYNHIHELLPEVHTTARIAGRQPPPRPRAGARAVGERRAPTRDPAPPPRYRQRASRSGDAPAPDRAGALPPRAAEPRAGLAVRDVLNQRPNITGELQQ
jgi:lysophospholipase L1-like esterase